MEQLTIRKADEKDRKQIAKTIAICYERDFSTLVKDMKKVTSALLPGIQISIFQHKKVINILVFMNIKESLSAVEK